MRAALTATILAMLLTPTPARHDGAHAELLQVAERMLADVRDRDVDAVIAHYDPGPTFAHIENGSLRTWPELERQMRTFIPALRESRLHWVGTPSILMVTDEAAVIFGRHEFSGVDANGNALPAHQGYWTGVMRRTGTGWKIVHSHSSDPHPASD